MRKLLTSTTALSLALSSFHTMPAGAQTLADDGSVIAEDGTVLCVPTAEAACDLEAITQALKAAEAEAAAAAEAAQAEAEAAAKAAEEAAAAEAAAQAEAEAAAKAAEEAAAAAAAEAAAQAEAEAAAKAAEEAAAAAAAEAAAQAEAEAAAKAAEEAAAAAAAEAAAQAEAAARAEAEAAARAAVEAVAEPEVAPEAASEATAEPAVEPATETAEEPAVEPAPETAEAPAVEPALEAVEDSTAEPAPEATAETAPEATTAEPEAVDVAEPVDVPEVSEEAADSLASILTAPTVAEETADTETAPTDEPALPAAAAVEAAVTENGANETAATDQPAPEAAPVAVTEEIVSEDTARSSDEEFAAAPVAVSEGKKSGLSDLEKVGLLALGALVVGAVINEGKKDQKKVVSNTGDRVVVENSDGSYVVYKDDDAILRRPGVRTVTETYKDGSTRTVVQRADGTEVVTIRDASGRVLRRVAYDRAGNPTILIDDLYPEERIEVSELPKPKPGRVTISTSDDDAALKAELAALEAEGLGRKFSLRQIREIKEVRALAATIEVDSITFDSGSAAIKATEARKLADIGRLMEELLAANPAEVFLIEGHTDAVGSAASNLALSDRRAESLALALTEYFGIPPENLVVQGYGESELKIETSGDERANRRVVVRLVTPLMRVAELR